MAAAPTIFLMLAYLLFAFGVLAFMFVLLGFGLWRMGRNAGVPCAWTAFFPLGSGYVMGALADRSRRFFTGRAPRLGLAFWLPITQALAVFAGMGLFGLALVRVPFNFLVVLFFLALLLGTLVSLGLNYFCVYHIFKNYAPENALLYTLVGLLFGIYWIFFLVEMNTVPVSVAGPGPFPYGRPKYGQQQPQSQWPQGGTVPGQPAQYQRQEDYGRGPNQGPEL